MQGLNCRSPGCWQQGLTSKDGYCNGCYTKSRNPSAEQFQWKDFDDRRISSPRVSDDRNTPAQGPAGVRQKCYKCNEFFALEEYHGLCSGCFKKLSIKESQKKPQPMQVQPTPVQANNNTERATDKCKVCKEFYGDIQFGGLCSVCFKNK